MRKAPLRFLRFMPHIVQDFEKAVHEHGESNLAAVAQAFRLPLRFLLDFQRLPGRSGDLHFTKSLLSDLKRLIKKITSRESMILNKYLERKAISYINRKTRHLQRSMMITALTAMERRR